MNGAFCNKKLILIVKFHAWLNLTRVFLMSSASIARQFTINYACKCLNLQTQSAALLKPIHCSLKTQLNFLLVLPSYPYRTMGEFVTFWLQRSCTTYIKKYLKKVQISIHVQWRSALWNKLNRSNRAHREIPISVLKSKSLLLELGPTRSNKTKQKQTREVQIWACTLGRAIEKDVIFPNYE